MDLSKFKKTDNEYIVDNLTTQSPNFTYVKRPESDFAEYKHNHIDTHLHSKYSLDGYIDVERIIQRALENSVDFISITDHNTVAAFHDLMKAEKKSDKDIIYKYDGVNVVCGSEVTCYMNIGNKQKIKFHLLCYGFDRSENSPIMDIINAKYNDYKQTQYQQLYYLAKKDEVYKTTTEEIKSYMREFDFNTKKNFSGCFTDDFTMDFYKWKGVNEVKIRSDIKDFYLKQYDQLKLDIIDVINATHKSGGLCSLAHPTVSMEKFIQKKNVNVAPFTFFKDVTDTLLYNGLDGIELSNKTKYFDLHYNNYYKDTYLVSCGSDLHYFSDLMYKDVGKYKNDTTNANIDKVMTELDKAKKNQTLTDKQKANLYIGYQDTTINRPYLKDIGYTNNNNYYNNHQRSK